MKRKALAFGLAFALLLCSMSDVAFGMTESAEEDIEYIIDYSQAAPIIENVEEENILTIGEKKNSISAENENTADKTDATDASVAASGEGVLGSIPENSEQDNVKIEDANIASGNYGTNLMWILSSDGTLTISGTGKMPSESNVPWYDYNGDILSVVIEEGVTSISESAFEYCYALKEVSISDTVTSIGSYAFENCQNLEKIIIPNSVVNIGESAFAYCNRLSSVTLSSNITEIADETFYSCSDLLEITIPNSVTGIGAYAFYSTGLKNIIIPGSVISIGDYAFWYCDNLEKVTIEEGVKSIGNSAFRSCFTLEEVDIPDTVTSIGENAFTDTPWIEKNESEDGLVIVNNVVIECTSDAESISIPNTVKGIAGRAFLNKKNLKQISIPESVSNIGDRAFENCTSLSSINIPDSLTSIQYGVFAGCESLTDVTIPNSVTSIGTWSFCGTGLKSITVSDKVTEIGDYALGYEKAEPGQITPTVTVEGFTIYGYPGTVAENYAAENIFNFISLDGSTGLAIVPDRTDDTYIRFSGQDVVIYCTGEFNKFVSVEMDGEIVDPSNYTVEEGSTVLTFASSYLDTLSTGRHTVTLNYIDGSISTYLTILDESGEGGNTGTGLGSGAGSGSGTGSGGTDSGTTNSKVLSGKVKTGDDVDITLWLVVGLVSAAMCTSMVIIKKRKTV